MSVNVLLLGTLTSEEQNKRFLSHGIRPAPADIVQKYLIEGLSSDTRICQLDAVCSPRIQPCHKNKIKRVEDCSFKIERGEIESVGFINLLGIGFAMREQRIVDAAKKWARKNKGNDTLVLIYSMQAKLPVLACTDPNTDVGEVIVNGGFGWWCESNDTDAFSTQVKKALEADLSAMGEKAFDYIEQNYNVNGAYNTIVKSFM